MSNNTLLAVFILFMTAVIAQGTMSISIKNSVQEDLAVSKLEYRQRDDTKNDRRAEYASWLVVGLGMFSAYCVYKRG